MKSLHMMMWYLTILLGILLSTVNGNRPPDIDDINYVTRSSITDTSVDIKYYTRTNNDVSRHVSNNGIVSKSVTTVASYTSLRKNDQVSTSSQPSTVLTGKTEYDSIAVTNHMTPSSANTDDKITTRYKLKLMQTKDVGNSVAGITPPITSYGPTTHISIIDACDTEYLEVTNTPVQVKAFTRYDSSLQTKCTLNVTVPNNTALSVRLINSGLNNVSTYFYMENVGNLPQNCTDRYVVVSVDHTPCVTIVSGSQFRFHFQNIDILVELYTVDFQISKCFHTQSTTIGQAQCKLKSYAKEIQQRIDKYWVSDGCVNMTRYLADCVCDCPCTCTLGYREWLSTCNNGKDMNTTRADLIVYNPNSKAISFANTGFNAIQENGFLGFYDLEILVLEQNSLSILTVLEQQSLSANHTSNTGVLPSGVFDLLGNLTVLDLSDNNIAVLPSGVFDVLGNLTVLNLSDNNIAVLPSGVFDLLGNLTVLDLSDNNIAVLPSGVFDVLGNLTVLDLSDNNIAVLPSGVFDLLGNLTVLDLSDNNIAVLPSGVFDLLGNLTVLDLSDNNIAVLPSGVFDLLGNLTVLNVSDNNIAVLPSGVFDLLGNLTVLDLSDNNIAVLPSGVFDLLGNLTVLDLNDNNIAVLPSGVFDLLGNLTVLNLSDNNIAVLPSGVFDFLGNLTVLDLNDNNIVVLPSGVFALLGNLTVLDLSGSNIATLPTGVFESLDELRYLSLRGNTITTLPEGVFDSLGKLWKVDMSDNNIDTLPAGVFDPLDRLGYLDMSHNNIAALPAGVLDSLVELWFLDLSDNMISFPVGVFDLLGNLTELNLSDNNIAVLPSGVFDLLGNLTVLDLSGNNIVALPTGVFESLGELRYLSLNDNTITTLPVDVFDSLGNLWKLDMSDNSIAALPAGVFDSLGKLRYLDMSDNNIDALLAGVFDSLGDLWYLTLSDNNIADLPSGVFDLLGNLTGLALSNNNIAALPAGVFASLGKLWKLDMSNNSIAALPAGVFDPLGNLKLLDMSNNNITASLAGVFDSLGNLWYLNLNDNNIGVLPAGVFDALGRLGYLDMSDNTIAALPSGVFDLLGNLTFLSVCKNNLVALPDQIFYYTNNLIFLSVSYNAIQKIGRKMFSNETKLRTFDMRKNEMFKISHDSFKTNPQNASIIVDKYATCCFMDKAQCVSIKPRPEYLTCKRMLQDVFLRISVWILGLSAFICNGIAYYVRRHKREADKVQTLLISHLSLSDLLMGVNMLILASADVYYGEYFPSYAHVWRQGFACKLAGFLSIFSSEGSVFFIALISIDCLLRIKYPFSGFQLYTKWTKFCVALAWLMAFLISVIPIALATDTGDVFSVSEVCIGIPIVKRHLTTFRNTSVEINITSITTTFRYKQLYEHSMKRWVSISTGVKIAQQLQQQNVTYTITNIIGSQISPIFSIVIFVGVNLTCFFIVALCYIYIFIKAGKTTLKGDKKIRMATKIFAIVLTDFCCWVPLSFICILVQCGVITVSPEMYAWTVGFILPINSSINPFLYVLYETISNHIKKKREKRKDRENIEMQVRWKPLLKFGLKFDQKE